MIRLFTSSETNFNHNKWVLNDTINCIVTETTDGIFDLDLTYPLNDMKNLSQYLVRGNIIKCPISQTDSRGEQLFTIRKRTPSTKENRITIYAQAKARRDLDLNMVLGLRVPAGQTRKQACQLILNACVEQQGYTIGNLDTNTNTSINLGLEADTGNVINYLDINGVSPRLGLLSESENSIYKAYGGEIIFNNFEINMVDERGTDHNLLIKSGKNLEDLQQDIDDTDTENFATAILPCSADGLYLPNSEIIYSPNAPILGKIFKKIVFDDVTAVDDSTEAINIVYAQLRERVQNKFNDGMDKLKINNTINFIQLANTDEYKDYATLERCEIGNNVTVRYYKRDDENIFIEATGRVVKIKFNVLKNKIEEVEVGERKKKSIVDTINNTKNIISTVNDKTNTNIATIKKVKKNSEQFQVTMEARADSIELSVANETDDRIAAINILDGQIESKVEKDDFGSYIEQNYASIAESIKTATGTHSMTLSNAGVAIDNGGFLIKDGSGSLAFECSEDGYVFIKDLILDDVAKKRGSEFYKSLMDMEELNLAQNGNTYISGLLVNSLTIQGQSFKSAVEDVLREHDLI